MPSPALVSKYSTWYSDFMWIFYQLVINWILLSYITFRQNRMQLKHVSWTSNPGDFAWLSFDQIIFYFISHLCFSSSLSNMSFIYVINLPFDFGLWFFLWTLLHSFYCPPAALISTCITLCIVREPGISHVLHCGLWLYFDSFFTMNVCMVVAILLHCCLFMSVQ